MDAVNELWSVAKRAGPVDARRLMGALGRIEAADVADADQRTQLLVRDAAEALRMFYGPERFRIQSSAARIDLAALDPLRPGERHFCLRGAMVDATDPEQLLSLLRDLGRRVHTPSRIVIGGSLALMLDGLIARETHDARIVDGLPHALRNEHDLLHEMMRRYRLQLTHFQSHYLNDDWRSRVISLGVFGSITAFRVDPIDVLVGKLFSSRTKDLDDVRLALPLVDRASFVDRVATTTARWRGEAKLHAAAASNWYVISGEETLPSAR